MKWIKQGLIFAPRTGYEWMASHTCVPTADLVGNDMLRVYYGPRDAEGRTTVARIDVAADDPSRILKVHERPVLGLGRLGAFDDDGAMPSCVLTLEGRKYLFYIGWNRGVTVSFRNAIGLAVSDDGGESFTRIGTGPILDRTLADPIFVSAPWVMVDEGRWKMWYLSATEWLVVDGRPEPVYLIKYADSADGLAWTPHAAPCLMPAYPGEAISRPCVLREGGRYRMWYCFRGSEGYRSDKAASYRIGYAESPDGITWTRRDDAVGIDISPAGWDSQMIENPCVYQHGGRKHMLYNGNGFGATGFGHAVLDETGVN